MLLLLHYLLCIWILVVVCIMDRTRILKWANEWIFSCVYYEYFWTPQLSSALESSASLWPVAAFPQIVSLGWLSRQIWHFPNFQHGYVRFQISKISNEINVWRWVGFHNRNTEILYFYTSFNNAIIIIIIIFDKVCAIISRHLHTTLCLTLHFSVAYFTDSFVGCSTMG